MRNRNLIEKCLRIIAALLRQFGREKRPNAHWVNDEDPMVLLERFASLILNVKRKQQARQESGRRGAVRLFVSESRQQDAKRFIAKLRDARNDWAHFKPFSDEATSRALDAAAGLAKVIRYECGPVSAQAESTRERILRLKSEIGNCETKKDEIERRCKDAASKGKVLQYLTDFRDLVNFDDNRERKEFFAMLCQISKATTAANGILLSVVVVGKSSGNPGPGFYDMAVDLGYTVGDRADFFQEQRDRVFAFYGNKEE